MTQTHTDLAPQHTSALQQWHDMCLPSLCSNRAAAYLALGMWDEALKDAERARMLAQDALKRTHTAGTLYIKTYAQKGEALIGEDRACVQFACSNAHQTANWYHTELDLGYAALRHMQLQCCMISPYRAKTAQWHISSCLYPKSRQHIKVVGFHVGLNFTPQEIELLLLGIPPTAAHRYVESTHLVKCWLTNTSCNMQAWGSTGRHL